MNYWKIGQNVYINRFRFQKALSTESIVVPERKGSPDQSFRVPSSLLSPREVNPQQCAVILLRGGAGIRVWNSCNGLACWSRHPEKRSRNFRKEKLWKSAEISFRECDQTLTGSCPGQDFEVYIMVNLLGHAVEWRRQGPAGLFVARILTI